MPEPIEKRTKRDILIEVYNERINRLVRMEIDVDYYNAMTLAFPGDKALFDEKIKNENSLTREKKMVAVIEAMIEEFDKDGKLSR